MVFFVNPSLFEQPKASKAGSRGGSSLTRRNTMMSPKGGKLVPDKIIDEPAEQLFNEISNFDIRKGVCNDLMNP